LSILEHFFRDFFTECVRVLKPTGCLYTFCDGQSYPVFFVTAYRYFRRLAPLVWDKMTSINGYSWRHQHELILYAEMNRAPLVPTGDGDIIRCRAVPVNSRMHPAEKPVELLQRLVEKSTVSIAMVLDPFMGSGATGVAAVQTGRKFIGVEISEEYCTIARERLAKAEGVKVCH
jgi:site-specific DNA-methyltransferase (adenine-specific)